MKKLLMIVMLAVFTVSAMGCYGGGECAHGVCNEEHSRKSAGETGTPPEDAASASEEDAGSASEEDAGSASEEESPPSEG